VFIINQLKEIPRAWMRDFSRTWSS